ncbi:MAG: Stk1 family PASTA domain-containing Ser/Thr kinase [Nitriliruptorales bacterium]
MSSSTSDGGRTQSAERLLAGRYRLDQLLGRGGMAEVWVGVDLTLEREVAVKVLSPRFSGDEQFQRRFRREAQQAASLSHPNIVAVYDTGRHGDLAFIVMEPIRGRSLQQVLQHGELTEERAVEVCAEVCGALAFAHARGLVHRDVKPGNILIADDATVKVTDFGIARAIASDTVTETAAVLGTAAYLSPEQAQGTAVDVRSDVYSLGVVLYEMLTGHQPFQGDSAVGVAYQHVQETPIPPREWDPTISAGAEAIAMKAMAKNPANRYPNAGAMRDDLLRARAGQPVSAPVVLGLDETAELDDPIVTTGARPPLTERQERRRHTVGYVGLGILTILAVAAGIWFLAGFITGGEQTLLRTVPTVRNLSPDQAEATLKARGLRFAFVGEEHSSEISRGRVVSQDPDAGMQVEDGTVVRLVTSKGAQPVVVPPVEDLSEEDARAELRAAQLVVGERRTEFSTEIARGRVIRTEPPAGRSVPIGSTVTLVVSAGEETEIVPHLEGLLESDARFLLQERGFRPLVIHEFSDSVEEGNVIRQEPQGGTEQPKGTEVTIVVSRGPEAPPEPTEQPTDGGEPSGSPSEQPTNEPTPDQTEGGD